MEKNPTYINKSKVDNYKHYVLYIDLFFLKQA